MNDKQTWKKGAPPSIGWWPASWTCAQGTIRWWNGEWWSCSVSVTCGAKEAGRIAKIKAQDRDEIEWSERWWL